MKLNELRNILNMSFDFADNELDASFYCELEEISEELAKKIEVVKITKGFVICDFKSFILHHKTKIISYLKNSYSSSYWKNYANGIFNNSNKYEAEEWIASFIEQDLASFLTEDNTLCN